MSGDEDEKIIPAFSDGAGKLAAGRRVRKLAQQLGEAGVEIGPVLNEGVVLEGLAPPADGDGAQEKNLETGREGSIALVDRILGRRAALHAITNVIAAKPAAVTVTRT